MPDEVTQRTLSFLRCGRCGELSFPAEAYGCRVCGAEPREGATVERPAGGVLREYATVHLDLVAGLPAPYVVGWVELAPGLIVESLLAVDSEAELEPGITVQPATGKVEVPASDDGVQALWFAPAVA
jgi:uncharacterized OB-fold protein